MYSGNPITLRGSSAPEVRLQASRTAVGINNSYRSLAMARLCPMWPRELAIVYSRNKGKQQTQLQGSALLGENEDTFTPEIASQLAGGGHRGGVMDLVLVSGRTRPFTIGQVDLRKIFGPAVLQSQDRQYLGGIRGSEPILAH